MTPEEIIVYLYNISSIPVIFFSIIFLLLAITYLITYDKPKIKKKKSDLPFVTVQICSFNDPVAVRCVKACLNFSYPKDKYEILILDDSTDKKTQKLLSAYAKNPIVKYVHRDNRIGYKPGALRDAQHLVRGEITVLFDADFIPEKDYLQKIVQPFEDPKVAIVQTRQVFFNKNTNLISRFASYLMMVYYTIIMPINNKANSVFFGGTAGALRVSAIKEAGGWNINSITEDSDLSLKILLLGYKSVFVDIETKGEAPVTIESFLKQQMRWTYGNFRVFLDQPKKILFSNLKWYQKTMISFFTLGNLIAPAVILMTLFGFTGWFFGNPELWTITDFITMVTTILYTSGFIILGVITLYKRRLLNEIPQLALSLISLSLVLACANTVALYKAAFTPNKPLFSKNKTSWICTPKAGNKSI